MGSKRYIKARDISGKIIYGFCYGRTYREAKEKVIKCKTEVYGGEVTQKVHEQPSSFHFTAANGCG